MQWGQIKSILIISFLILNIYLLIQFLDKKEQADYSIIEEQQSTFEELLKAESITIPELKTDDSSTYLSVKHQLLTNDDLKLGKDQIAQNAVLLNDHFILSAIDKPIRVDGDQPNEYYEELKKQLFYQPESYTYWGWNENLNVLIYFQKKADRSIYYNQNGIVVVYLNDNNDAIYYTQTILGQEEFLAEANELIKPLEAIETLYRANILQSGDDVKRVNLGFYTRVPYEGDVQVFAPTWKVNINDTQDYFINAIEGFIFSTDENEFLYEVVQGTKDNVKSSNTNGAEFIDEFGQLLETKMEMLESGEIE